MEGVETPQEASAHTMDAISAGRHWWKATRRGNASKRSRPSADVPLFGRRWRKAAPRMTWREGGSGARVGVGRGWEWGEVWPVL